jgi:imidazoleglycerol-phosphate dehydratase
MSELTRETKETTIRGALTRTGPVKIATTVPFLDHMMTVLARYAGVGLTIEASGDLRHHIIEDVAIVIGSLVREEFRPPIRRYGHAVVPMDDAVVECAFDLGGRPYYRGPLPSGLYDHWMRSFADHAQCTLHLIKRRGSDRHHIVEAGFKALGMALAEAIVPADVIASTKGNVRLAP